MKKFLVTILTFVYISTDIGVNINIHYCMGKIIGWEFGYTESKNCPKCGMTKLDKKNNGCCIEEHTFLKNSTDQKNTKSAFLFVQQFNLTVPEAFIEVPPTNLAAAAKANSINHITALYPGIPIYILNCVYRI
jgi:hypothetical protein